MLYICFNKGQSSSDFASWANWPRKSAAMVTLRATSFLSLMIDSVISIGVWMLLVKGMQMDNDCELEVSSVDSK